MTNPGSGISILIKTGSCISSHSPEICFGSNHLENVLFEANRATTFAGAAQFSMGYTFNSNQPHETTIVDTEFINNMSRGDAGAIWLRDGISDWSNVQFSGNTATGENGVLQTDGDGGVGVIDQGEHHFEQIWAQGNQAGEDGGVFDVRGEEGAVTIEISDSVFEDNFAEDDAGVIHIRSNALGLATAELEGITAQNNSTTGSGGFARLIDGVEVNITDSELTNNNAGLEGGALTIEGSQVNVINTELRENQATYGGGAIRVSLGQFLPVLEAPGVLNLINGQVIGNESILSEGGGILADHGSIIEIANTHLNGNQAAIEGAALYAAPSLDLRPAAEVTMINTIVANSVTDLNNNGTGASAVYISPSIEENSSSGSLIPSDPAEFTIYNSILANTVNSQGETVSDYGGAAPVVAENNLVSQLESLSRWDDNSNQLNIHPSLTSIGDGLFAPTLDSSAVDAGDLEWLPDDTFDLDGDGNITEQLPVDSEGGSRIINGIVDLGPIEVDDPDVSQGNDRILGNDGENRINGGSDHDVLEGGVGDDLIDGGSGNDTLTGGAGQDQFILAAGYGSDLITDFENGQDLLVLDGITFEQLVIEPTGNGTDVKLGEELLVHLDGIDSHLIASDDFSNLVKDGGF